MKRFYKLVSLYKAVDGYGLHLDGKPVKTPAGKILLVPDENLATELMLEWSAQEKDILPHTMPVNQIVITSLDGGDDRASIEAHILSYIDTDLVFYRSNASPYKEQQEEKWGKWTDWFEKFFSVSLAVTTDIMPLTQAKAVSEAVKAYIGKLTFLDLILFDSMVEDTSSPVLTMAFFEGAASAQDLFDAIFLEDMVKAEIYDEETYGAAPDQEKKRIRIRSNLEAARRILSLKKN